MVHQDDPDWVRAQYASEAPLLRRRSIYADTEGPDAIDVLVATVAEAKPRHLLEVGCGPGHLAERLSQTVEHVEALDLSPRMVELVRARGVAAQVGDVQSLPFPDAAFDCVVAAWMLYHVRALDRGLDEIQRVLRPGGRVIAATNSEHHLQELWDLLGMEGYEFGFRAENGGEVLGRHFAEVELRWIDGAVTFPDRAAAYDYLASASRIAHLAERLPPFAGALRARRRAAVFVATKR